MTTVEEKDLELVALQATFDEYVESSKELETELESELEKVRTPRELPRQPMASLSPSSLSPPPKADAMALNMAYSSSSSSESPPMPSLACEDLVVVLTTLARLMNTVVADSTRCHLFIAFHT